MGEVVNFPVRLHSVNSKYHALWEVEKAKEQVYAERERVSALDEAESREELGITIILELARKAGLSSEMAYLIVKETLDAHDERVWLTGGGAA